MTIETGVVVGEGREPLYWHLPEGRSSGSLPDSRELWDFLWEHRHEVRGFAHSHPGSGWPNPSDTDVTTFAAIEGALGRRLIWWITSADTLVAYHWVGPGKHDYKGFIIQDTAEPVWVKELRKHSWYGHQHISLGEEVDALASEGLPPGKITEIYGYEAREHDKSYLTPPRGPQDSQEK